MVKYLKAVNTFFLSCEFIKAFDILWFFLKFYCLCVCVCFNPFFPIKVSRLQVSDYEYFGTQILIPLKRNEASTIHFFSKDSF